MRSWFEKSNTVLLIENIGNYPRLWMERHILLTEIGKNQTKTRIIDHSFITIRLFYCYTFSLMTTDIDIKTTFCTGIFPLHFPISCFER